MDEHEIDLNSILSRDGINFPSPGCFIAQLQLSTGFSQSGQIRTSYVVAQAGVVKQATFQHANVAGTGEQRDRHDSMYRMREGTAREPLQHIGDLLVQITRVQGRPGMFVLVTKACG